jgi:ABC-2 type transport system ATP-binding protein/lipopolysaccharide transport system ATP-binding protein
MGDRTVISVEGVSKRYRLGEQHTSVRDVVDDIGGRLRGRRHAPEREELWALEDVSFEVSEGQAVGIIGRNGAGKSTLLKVLTRITEPTSGVSRTFGRVGALLEVGTGFHNELTGRENVFLNAAIIGMSRREARRRFDEIVEFAGVERFVDTPVKRYSSGMYLRLAFGVAAHLDADIMVVDEVLAVGDAEFQRKCLAKMGDIERSGRTVIFVSHDIDAIARLCPRVLWLDRGRLVQDGSTEQVVTTYLRSALDGHTATGIEPEPGAPVVVERIRICDSSGQPASVVPRSEAFVVEVDFLLERDVPDLNLSALVDTLSGARLLDEAWSEADPPLLRRAGKYHLRLTVPPVLNAGEYTLSLWIGTPYETFVWADSLVTFRLEGSSNGRPERILQLALPWSTDFRPPGSAAP